jgi:hypothetical protein
MRTANGTRAAWLISLGGTVGLVAVLGPVELRAAQSVELVKAEGYVEVYSIQYRHTLYEVKVRDAEGLRVELFVHPSIRKPLRNRGGELISKNFES